MTSTNPPVSSGTNPRAGRKSRRGQKSKVSSFSDEVPTFIEEIIPDSQPPLVVRYAIGEVLGKGAAATVYKGKNVNTGELVAIKKIFKGGMRSEQLKTFLKAVETEFSLMRGLNHPNIVQMKGRVEDQFNIYIILEYVNGGSLATYLSKYQTFPPEIAAVQMKQVLQGLQYLHERNIVHRDIKAANLLITKSGVVKLADFGVSAQLETAEKRYSVVGTPYWMAPEVISMTGHTGKSDIWSLGCTLLELIVGHPPYWELDQMRAVFCIVQDETPPIPPEITGDLCRFLHKCFIKDPERRASAAELLTHPYIVSARLPETSPSGKLDARALKINLKAFHGLPADDSINSYTSTTSSITTPPASGKTNGAPSFASATAASGKLPSGGSTAITPRGSAQTQDHVIVQLDSTNTRSRATSNASSRNVAVVKNSTPSVEDDDPYAPVPSVQKYDEGSALIADPRLKYSVESGDDSSPCCNIL